MLNLRRKKLIQIKRKVAFPYLIVAVAIGYPGQSAAIGLELIALDYFDKKTENSFIYIGNYAYNESIRVPWQKHDVLILNNNLMMHSRDPFIGKRKILVSLVK